MKMRKKATTSVCEMKHTNEQYHGRVDKIRNGEREDGGWRVEEMNE